MVLGNEANVKQLQAFAKSEKRPHTYLFTGGSGQGKTTMARIFAKELGADDLTIKEMNLADNRGIDTMRELIENMKYVSHGGKPTVYILDECFHENTEIMTLSGDRYIKDLSVGDSVVSVVGTSKIKHIFKNKVPVQRVCKITFTNGKIIYCSVEHKFFTSVGWLEAHKLDKKVDILCINSNIVKQIKLNEVTIEKNTKVKNLSNLWKFFYPKNEQGNVLFKILSDEISEQQKEPHKNMFRMFTGIWNKKSKAGILFSKMCGIKQNKTSGNSGGVEAWDSKEERISKEIFSNRKREATSERIVGKDEEKQSYKFPGGTGKGTGDKTEKRDSSYFCWNSWGQWAINRTTKTISFCIKLAGRILYIFRKTSIWFSDKLQSRYCLPGKETCNRSGWKRARFPKKENAGFEENSKIEFFRVESVEIFKSGDNDKSFTGIITDKERALGYCLFYDLEIEGHPSYFANSCLVHNCHRATADAQSAMLKPFEDTPKHVYFILCTTEPGKVLKTIKTRCTEIQVEPVENRDLFSYLSGVCKSEEFNVSKEVLKAIMKAADGSVRKALVMLEQAANLEDEEEQLKAVNKPAEEEATTIELCHALLERNWKNCSNILKALKEQKAEAESVRYAVLGYMSAVLLNSGKSTPAYVMECFSENTYDTKFNGIVLMTYQACCGE